MKAIVMTATGSPEVLEVQQVATPTISQPRDLLIQIKAAGVNPVDTKLRSRGTFYPEQMPAILGCDGAGIVTAIGSEVKNFQVGDEVYFCYGGVGNPPGTYAEYTVINEQFVAHKPKSLSFVEAAAAPLVLITAWESLYDRARLKSGDKTLILAGAGGVGHVAIQLAKIQGAEVATTVSSEEKADFVKSMGADLVIMKEDDCIDQILIWTRAKGVDVAFDTVGGKTFFDIVPAVKIYGDLVTILDIDPSLGNLKNARLRNLRISLELMLTPMLQGLDSALIEQVEILTKCADLFDRGKLKIHVNKTFALDDAVEAHRLLEAGSMVGKIVLTMGE
jgi:NADPH2:quinone reductase